MWSLLLFSIVIVRLPAAFGDEAPAWAYAPAPLIFGTAAALLAPRVRRLHASAGGLVVLAAFLVLMAVAYWRAVGAEAIYGPYSAAYSTAAYFSLTAFAVLALLGDDDPHRTASRLMAVSLAPLVYVAVNVALRGADINTTPPGLTAATPGPATLLGFVGVSAERAFFGMSAGINNFGAVASCALATGVILTVLCRHWRQVVAAILSVTTLYALLAIDSRGALLFGVAAAFVVLAVPHHASKLALLPLLLLVGPLFVTAVLSLLGSTDLSDILSRRNGDFVSATGRVEVWQPILEFLSHPRFEHLVGYGYYGQLESGVSLEYAYGFGAWAHPENAPAHSFVLQTVLDTGYLGLSVSVGLLAIILRSAARNLSAGPSPALPAILAGLVALVLTGLLESAPTTNQPDAFAVLLLFGAAALRSDAASVRSVASMDARYSLSQPGRSKVGRSIAQGLVR